MSERRPGQPFAHQGSVLVMAHRGWRGRYPENTLLAFHKAVELGVDALELDIHATQDGTLVVCHDESVDRTTDGKGMIRHLSWPAVQALEVGGAWTADGGVSFPFRGLGLKMPALEEVLSAFPDHWLNIDIKQRMPRIVSPFVEMVRDYHAEDRVCVGSFHPDVVAELRRACPDIVTVATGPEVRRLFWLSRAGLAGLYHRGPERAVQLPLRHGRTTVVTSRFVRAAHANRLAVHVWTVNEVEEMRSLISQGVDGIITDHPDRLVDVLLGNEVLETGPS